MDFVFGLNWSSYCDISQKLLIYKKVNLCRISSCTCSFPKFLLRRQWNKVLIVSTIKRKKYLPYKNKVWNLPSLCFLSPIKFHCPDFPPLLQIDQIERSHEDVQLNACTTLLLPSKIDRLENHDPEDDRAGETLSSCLTRINETMYTKSCPFKTSWKCRSPIVRVARTRNTIPLKEATTIAP